MPHEHEHQEHEHHQEHSDTSHHHDDHGHEHHSHARSRVVYFDPCAGAAGDMITAALIDAGADLAAVQAAIASVGIADLRVEVAPLMKGVLGALKYHVHADESQMPDHLGPDDLITIIGRAAVSNAVKTRAVSVIERVASAEARIHRVPRETIQFHELGGLDTIADVLGTLVALESLGITRCFTGPLPMNGGTWGMQHGQLPLPAPATLEIIAAGHLDVIAASAAIPPGKELVTPTGAALLTEVAHPGLPKITLERIGYGAGTRDLPVPNILRVWVGWLA